MSVARKSTLAPEAVSEGALEHAPGQSDALFTSLYHELHRLARREAARAGAGAVLSATTIIHEVYLDMSQRDSLAFPDRARFLAYAARAMRAVVIDRARASGAQKRGGGLDITSLDTETAQSVAEPGLLSDIGAALDELAALEPALGRRRRPEVLLRLLVRRDRGAAAASRSAPCSASWEKARLLLYTCSSAPDSDGHAHDRHRRRALEAYQPAARRAARSRPTRPVSSGSPPCAAAIRRWPTSWRSLIADAAAEPKRGAVPRRARRARRRGARAAPPRAWPGTGIGAYGSRRRSGRAARARVAGARAATGRFEGQVAVKLLERRRSSAAAGAMRFAREGDDPGAPVAPAHRPPARRRRHRRRPALSRPRARRGRAHRPLLRRNARLGVEARIRVCSCDVLEAVAHAHAQPDRPSRHQAGQHPGERRRPA